VQGSKTAAQICTNVNSSTITQLKADIDTFCANITAVEKAQTAEKKECDTVFQACRKSERSTASEVDRCRTPELKCELQGNLTKAQAEVELATANKVLSALQESERKFNGALNSAGKAQGVGADGQLPANASLASGSRQQEASGCTAVKDGWVKFNQSAMAAVATADQEVVDPVKADQAIADLDAINARPALTADLISCNPGRQAISAYLAIVQIRFYVFWGTWWRQFIIEVRITIITVTYQLGTSVASTLPPDITTTTAPAATTTAGLATAPATTTTAITTTAAPATTTVSQATTTTGPTTTMGPVTTTSESTTTTAASTTTTDASTTTIAASTTTTAASTTTTAASTATTPVLTTTTPVLSSSTSAAPTTTPASTTEAPTTTGSPARGGR